VTRKCSNVILHVRDAAHPDSQAQRADVAAVLDGMAEDGTLAPGWSARTIEVLNKADLLGGVGRVPARSGDVVVSALTGEGLPRLREEIDARISGDLETVGYDVPASDGARLAWLYEHGEVVDRRDGDEATHVTVRLNSGGRARFERRSFQLGRADDAPLGGDGGDRRSGPPAAPPPAGPER
jgi:GTP-binding protein HflX